MCLARIEFVGEGQNKHREPLADVARIDPMPSGFTVTDLMGTVSRIAGEIQSIDFMRSVVRIRDAEGPSESEQ
jgi:predicted RNA-binding protein